MKSESEQSPGCHGVLSDPPGPSTSYSTVVNIDTKGPSVFCGGLRKPPTVSVTLGEAVSGNASDKETEEETKPVPHGKPKKRSVLLKHKRPPPDYVTIAVIMCFCFPLIGIPFLLFSCLSRSARSRGNLTLAWEYSQIALYLFTVEMAILVLILIVAMVMIWICSHAMYVQMEDIQEEYMDKKPIFPQGDIENVETFMRNITAQSVPTNLKNKHQWDVWYQRNNTV